MPQETAATAEFIATFGGEHRLLQDAPIQADVWVELARRRDAHLAARKAADRAGDEGRPVPGNWAPLLITPFGESTAAQVAALLADHLEAWRARHPPARPQGPGGRLPVSVPGLVLAWMTLEEVAAIALPLTRWWELQRDDPDGRLARARELVDWLLASPSQRRRWSGPTGQAEALEAEAQAAREAAASDGELARDLLRVQPAARPPRIHRIALDRQISMAQETVSGEASRTIKADAARLLFNVHCDRIRWAVIDSGIDIRSGGFGEGDALRVELAYDFSRLTRWLAQAQERQDTPGAQQALAELRSSIEETFLRRDPDVRRIRPHVLELESRLREAERLSAQARDALLKTPDDSAMAEAHDRAVAMSADLGTALAAARLELDAATARAKAPAAEQARTLAEHLRIRHRAGRDFDWEMLEPVLEVAVDTPPRGAAGRPDKHGTAVAGVLAADHPLVRGVCPDLRLVDLRVLSVEPRDADSDRPAGRGAAAAENVFIREFDVLSALKFVRYLNARERAMFIHGVNLSLQTPHDVTAYGCGATLLCEEVDKTSNDGVVVVVASGNDGHRVTPDVKGRAVAHYVSSSITDPGNAEEAITVGSTHRRDPHRYGVSYFSGRGPTGDGRRKPDLVAPGEKIPTLTPTGGQSTEMDGTSFAAPHVSGAAAMLMARHPELVGRPRRIKQILMQSATDLGRARDFQGAGLLDVLRAMQSV